MARSGQAPATRPTFDDFASFEGEEELDLTPLPAVRAEAKAKPPAALDLSGKPKVWFLRGRGRSGKTVLARWIVETAAERGGEMIVCALDQGGRRSLGDYIEGVQQPSSGDPARVARWTEARIRYAMENKVSVLFDTGGGDTSVANLLAVAPDLAAMLDEAQVPAVAAYVIGPSPNDLAVLASDAAAGFAPAATVIVRNMGLCDPTMDGEAAFGRVTAHSVMKAAVARGAVVVDMPLIHGGAAPEIEAKRLHFAWARDGKSPPGRDVPPLGPFDRARVRVWLSQMAAQFDPIRSWLPE